MKNVSPVTVPPKSAWVMKDLLRFARRYDVPLVFNPYFPINTLTLMRAAVAVQVHFPEQEHRFMGAVFAAIWVEKMNMGDTDVVRRLLSEKGFDADRILDHAASNAVKNVLKENTEEAVRRGVFGAPAIFVGEELFFGQDRLDFVRDALGG